MGVPFDLLVRYVLTVVGVSLLSLYEWVSSELSVGSLRGKEL